MMPHARFIFYVKPSIGIEVRYDVGCDTALSDICYAAPMRCAVQQLQQQLADSRHRTAALQVPPINPLGTLIYPARYLHRPPGSGSFALSCRCGRQLKVLNLEAAASGRESTLAEAQTRELEGDLAARRLRDQAL
eukprot:2261382-Rhodomonas_salina.1